MPTVDPFSALSIEQISDVINRQKIGSQRQKNEMIRAGVTDPTSFRLQNQKYLDQQNQELNPSTGLQPQSTQDSSLYNQLYQQPNQQQKSSYQFGTDGYTTKDIGNGQYDIYSTTGDNIGRGYKSVNEAISDYTKQYDLSSRELGRVVNNPVSEERRWGYNQDTGEAPVDVTSMSDNDYLEYIKNNYGIGRDPIYEQQQGESQPLINQWDTLSQLLNGSYRRDTHGLNPEAIAPNNDLNIKGLNALYGSTPVISNNKVVGYKLPINLVNEGDFGYVDPLHTKLADTHGATKWFKSLGREYNEPDTWSKMLTGIDKNNAFVSVNDAPNLPGFRQTHDEDYSHQTHVNPLVKALGAALSFTPLAPLGVAISTIGNAVESNGNPAGVLSSMLGGALNLGGAGGALGSSLGIGENAGNALISGTSKLAQGLATHKGLGNSILSGLGSAGGSYLGGELGGSLEPTLGQFGSNVVGKATGGALQNLLTHGNIAQGAALGGLSGGLGSFLSTMTDTGNPIQDKKQQQANQGLSKTIINLANAKRMKRF